MSFITSLISFGVYWIFRPFFSLLLYIDGVVYSLVAYSYKVFMLMAQLNFNVIYAWVAPLIDRIKAIIMVLIMFKLGYSLIQYMINPDRLSDKTIGGAALIKNIAWCSILLISYTFIFSVMNELSMLVIGVPKGYEFTTLKEIADVTTNDGAEADGGLISRFIFGTQAKDVGDFGMYLATTTLQVFLHGKDNQNSLAETIYAKQLENSENGNINTFDLTKITDVVSELDKTVEYKFPILSTAMAIYLIWSIVKLSIEIGVRMFKLIVLQIMAPVAIVSIIDKGFEAKPWKAFIDTYWKTWVDAFIRVASLFLVTAFISKFWTDRSALFPQIDGFTRYMVLIIVIFAAYRFAQLLPKFIDGILGHSLSENNSKGFGKVLGGIAGFGLGTVGGLITGAAGGAGVAGTLGNMISGGIGGANAGRRGDNVSSFFRNQVANTQSSRERAGRIAAQGGGLRYAGSRLEHMVGLDRNADARAQLYENRVNAYDALDNAKLDAIENEKSKDGIAYGRDEKSFVENSMNKYYENSSELQRLEVAENNIRSNGSLGANAQMNELNKINAERERVKAKIKANNESRLKAEWQQKYKDAKDTNGSHAIENAERRVKAVGGSAGRSAVQDGSRESITTARNAVKDKQESITSSGTYQRAHRQDK